MKYNPLWYFRNLILYWLIKHSWVYIIVIAIGLLTWLCCLILPIIPTWMVLCLLDVSSVILFSIFYNWLVRNPILYKHVFNLHMIWYLIILIMVLLLGLNQNSWVIPHIQILSISYLMLIWSLQKELQSHFKISFVFISMWLVWSILLVFLLYWSYFPIYWYSQFVYQYILVYALLMIAYTIGISWITNSIQD